MVSKNNIKNILEQNAKRVSRYRLQKTTLGVASVLLGTLCYYNGTAVHADTVDSSKNDANQETMNQVSQPYTATGQQNDQLVSQSGASAQPAGGSTDMKNSQSVGQDAANPNVTTNMLRVGNQQTGNVNALAESKIQENTVVNTVHRYINVTDPAGHVTQHDQTARFNSVDGGRTWTVGIQDGDKASYVSSDHKFPEYKLPEYSGYQPTASTGVLTKDGKSVASVIVSPDMASDITVDVAYEKLQGSTQVDFLDGSNVIASQTYQGADGDSVKFDSVVPDGYQLAANDQKQFDNLKNGVIIKGNQVVSLHVTPVVVTVDSDNLPKSGAIIPGTKGVVYPANVNNLSNFKRTITRTINVTMPDGSVKVVNGGSVTFTRSASVNAALGTVTFSDWNQASTTLPKVTLPSVSAGWVYQGNRDVLGDMVVTPDSANIVASGKFVQQNGALTVHFVEDGADMVSPVTIDGHIGDHLDLSKVSVPAGFQLVKGASIPKSVDLTQADQELNIGVASIVYTVSADNPKEPGEVLPGDSKNELGGYPGGLTASDLNKTVTRTINVKSPDGKVKTIKQTAKLSRNATFTIESDVNYGPWSTSSWAAYTAPVVAGYTASQSLPNVDVNGDTKDESVDIEYAPVETSVKINYLDEEESNKNVLSDSLGGKVGQNVTVALRVPEGYVLDSSHQVPVTLTLQSSNADINVYLKHQHMTVNGNDFHSKGDSINGTSLTWPAGVDLHDLRKDRGRLITIEYPNGKQDQVRQSVTLTRNADVDIISGHVTYGSWPTGKLDAYTAPTVAGYQPSQSVINGVDVNDTNKLDDVTITYQAADVTVNVVYQSVDGDAIVKTVPLSGTVGQTIDVPVNVPAGWELVKGPAKTVTLKASGNADLVVTMKHKTVTVNADSPKSITDKLPDNPGKSFPSGVDTNDLNKQVVRTIHVHNVDGTISTTQQTAKLSRNAVVDEVSGNVTYTNWSTSSWAAYTAPVVAGYTASQSLPKVDVNGDNKDESVDIEYAPVETSLKINYLDEEENNKNVLSDSLGGKVGQNVTVALRVPEGYVLDSSHQVPVTLTLQSSNADISVYLKHQHMAVNGDDCHSKGDNINGTSLTWPAGVDLHDLRKDRGRLITIEYPNGKQDQVEQSVTLTRNADVDIISGHVVYGSWSTGKLDAYTAPTVAGYQPSQSVVNRVNVNDTNKLDDVTITYQASDATVNVVYQSVDGDAIVKTVPLSGVVGQTIDVPVNVPAGWELVEAPAKTVTLKASGNTDLVVTMKHQTVTVNADSPKSITDKLPDNPGKSFPSGVDTNDLNKQVVRTIHVHNVDGTISTTQQTAKLSRKAVVDEVNGNVTYTNWSAGSWDVFNAPAVAGYQANQNAPMLTVNSDTKDQTVDISYISQSHVIQINYVDEVTNKTVKTDSLTGKTGEQLSVNVQSPDGYVQDSVKTVPTSIVVSSDPQSVNVYLKHRIMLVNADQAHNKGDQVTDTSLVWPAGVSTNDLTKTITRTITLVMPNGQHKQVTQKVTLSRTAWVDLIAGEVTNYGNWSTGEWVAYTVPTVAGYTPSTAVVDSQVVNDQIDNASVTVNYVAEGQALNVLFQAANQVVKTVPVAGQTGEIVKPNLTLPAGWVLVDGAKLPTEISFRSSGNADIVVPVKHGVITIEPSNPHDPSETLPDNQDSHYPEGLTASDLNNYVVREIVVKDPHTGNHVTKQTVHLTRTATVDEVTGEMHYSDWTTGDWAEFMTPVVAGYTASQNDVARVPVKIGMQDQKVTITYTAKQQTGKISYVDANGKEIGNTSLTGVTDGKVAIKLVIPIGWKEVAGQKVPESVVATATGIPTVKVQIEHQKVNIKSGETHHAGDLIDPNDPNGLRYPAGLDGQDLNQTITRVVEIVDPHTGSHKTTQTVTLHRDGQLDEATMKVTYGKWSTGKFDAVNVPKVAGYTARQDNVSAESVIDGMKDSNVKVTYAANEQHGEIDYVDAKGSVIKKDALSGKTDDMVVVKLALPQGWKLVDGQHVPENVVAQADGIPTVKVQIEHDVANIKPGEVHHPGDPIDPKIPNGPKYPAGLEDKDLNKTYQRTITVNDPHKGAQKIVQKVTLHRNGHLDLATMAVSYDPWNTDAFAEYVVPTVAGYTPSQIKVTKVVVTDGMKPEDVTINYAANDQTGEVDYVDNAGKVIKTDKLAGKTAQVVKVNVQVPKGWKLVDNEKVPESVTATADGIPMVKVVIEHQTYNLKPGESHQAGDPIDPSDPEGLKYPKGLTDEDLHKEVLRTIVLEQPGKPVKLINQRAELSRTATFDAVAGTVKYSPWSKAEFAEYDVPVIAGYTPSQAKVLKQAVDGNTKDSQVEIQYLANEQTGEIDYVDAKGNVIAKTKLAGKTDQDVNIDVKAPMGWVVAKDQKLPESVKATADGIPTVKVVIEHENVNVKPGEMHHAGDPIDPSNPDGLKYPAGLEDKDLRGGGGGAGVINVPKAQVKTVTQTAKLHRTASFDAVTGKVTYDKWSTGTFDAVNVPKVAGYTASQANVAAENVTDGMKDSNVKVTYTANEQHGEIDYVDAKGNMIKKDLLVGKTDAKVVIKLALPQGWKLVDGQHVSENVVAQADGIPTVKVQIEHVVDNINPGEVHHPGDPIDPKNPNGPKYPAGLEDKDLNETYQRTITVNDPHKGAQKIVQKVTLHRNGHLDLATMKVSYDPWNTGAFAEYVVPTVAGYTASQDEVGKVIVTDGMKPEDVTINYTANDQFGEVDYVDNVGKVIKTDKLAGKTDQDIKVNVQVPKGWKLVGNEKVPESVKATADGIPTVKIVIEHRTYNLKPGESHQAGDPIDPSDPDGPKYPKGLTNEDLHKEAIRTIVLEQPGKPVKLINQKAELSRTATFDAVAGMVKYSPWSKAEFAEYGVPVVAGYTPSQAKVAKQAVDGNTKDSQVEVQYLANDQTGEIDYVDAKGNVIAKTKLAGKTDQTLNVNVKAPAGWVVAKDQKLPASVKATADGIPTIKVVVEHENVNVKPGETHHAGDPIDPSNPDGPKYPKGLEDKDLNQTITRTVIINVPNAQAKTVTQTAKLHRTASFDAVSGKVTYGKWSEAKFDAVNVPLVAGYTASQANVAAENVTDGMKDSKVVVNYVANKQTGEIDYVDAKGNVIGKTSISGKTDETVKVHVKVPAGWQLVAGQHLPESVKATADGIPTVKVLIEHASVNIKPGESHHAGDLIDPNNPDGPKYPEGLEDKDLNRDATRTINITTPDGKMKTIAQKAHLQRDASLDPVTGKVTYSGWKVTEGGWPAVEVPGVDGYTSNVKKIPAGDPINGTGKDVNVKVTYDAKTYDGEVDLVDNTGKVISKTPVSGKTGEDVPVDIKLPAGWKLADGQKLPKTVEVTADGIAPVKVVVEHENVNVKPGESHHAGDPIDPNNPDGPKYPEGLENKDLNRDVTRTITITTPDGKTKTIKQTAHLQRDAGLDVATGKVTYGDWKVVSGGWPAVEVPVADGYTASVKEIPAGDPVTGIGKGAGGDVKVTYSANEQSATLVVKDADGNVIAKTTVTGKTGETVPVHFDLPKGYTVDGKLPTSYTFNGKEAETGEVAVKAVAEKVAAANDNGGNEGQNMRSTMVGNVAPTAMITGVGVSNAISVPTDNGKGVQKNAKTLPQTGNQRELAIVALGLSSLGLVAGLMKKREF